MRKKKIFKILSLILLMLLLASSIVGCSASDVDIEGDYVSNKVDSSFLDSENSYYNETEDVVDETGDTKSEKAETNRKIIEKIYINAETKTFDETYEKLIKEITEVGGYIESSNTYGNSYDEETIRSAHMTVRVP